MQDSTIRLGIIGAGRATRLHLDALAYVGNCRVVVKRVVAPREEQLRELCAAYPRIRSVSTNVESLFSDPDLDVVDICSPPYTHIPYTRKAILARKHVICEKPLSGYFGLTGDSAPIGRTVPAEKMLAHISCELEELGQLIESSGCSFFYAENFLYTPAMQKCAEIIRARNSRLLFMKGEESLRGSTSHVAGEWDKSGGGTLIRTGIHPLSAILWLKKVEAEARQENIAIEKVSCETGHVLSTLSEAERAHIDARPHDVEDLGILTISFSDHTKALVLASDTLLGGSRNYVEVYANNAVLRCNLTMHNAMECFLPDQENMENVEISEMTRIKTGWNNPFIGDEFIRGYIPEMQHFMECLTTGKKPICSFDLAAEIIRTLYAGYVSDREGKTLYLNTPPAMRHNAEISPTCTGQSGVQIFTADCLKGNKNMANAEFLETLSGEIVAGGESLRSSITGTNQQIITCMQECERLEWLLLSKMSVTSQINSDFYEQYIPAIFRLLDKRLNVYDDEVLSRINIVLAYFINYAHSEIMSAPARHIYDFIYEKRDDISFIESYMSQQSNIILLRQLCLNIIALLLNIPTYNKDLANQDSVTYKVIKFLDSLIGFSFPPGLAELGTNDHYNFDLLLKERDIALDCGAYTGDTAEVMSRLVGSEGKVFAFEPLDESFARCQALNLVNCEFFKCCLAETHGEASFSRAEHEAGASCLSADGELTVPLISIDEFVRQHDLKKVDFIKMDIEGAELAALKGAAATIGKFRPTLAISIYHNGGRDLVDVPHYLCSNYGQIYDFSLHQSGFGIAETILIATPKKLEA